MPWKKVLGDGQVPIVAMAKGDVMVFKVIGEEESLRYPGKYLLRCRTLDTGEEFLLVKHTGLSAIDKGLEAGYSIFLAENLGKDRNGRYTYRVLAWESEGDDIFQDEEGVRAMERTRKILNDWGGI